MEGRKKLHWGLKTHGLSFVFILLPPLRESLRLTLQLWMGSVTDDSKGQDPEEEQEVKTARLKHLFQWQLAHLRKRRAGWAIGVRSGCRHTYAPGRYSGVTLRWQHPWLLLLSGTSKRRHLGAVFEVCCIKFAVKNGIKVRWDRYVCSLMAFLRQRNCI